MAVTLYRFGRRATGWRGPEELVDEILLPSVRDRIPTRGDWDPAALVLRTRLLRPLERFGLCELREEEPGDLSHLPRTRWRKSPLFDRFLRFRV